MSESDGRSAAAMATVSDDVRLALASYQVLFERAALTAQLSDDDRLHRMLDALALFALVIDMNGDITYANTALLDRVGRPLEELIGRGLVDDPEKHELRNSMTSAISAGQPAPEWVSEIPVCDGSTMTVRWTSTYIRDTDGRISALTSVGEDITGRVPGDEQVTESARMESVGRLAGGIAHDFNGYLTIICGHTGLARATPGLPDGVTPHLDQIDAATARATDLIRQLLAFSRHDVLEPVTLSVSAALGELATLLRPTFRSLITLDIVTNAADDLVKFDRGRLDQIFVNLAFNARDAMPDGGAITFTVSGEVLDATGAADLGVEPGSYVVVKVADDGVGVDADIIDRVFERNVTTKPSGQGGGLGLSTVWGVISQAGGTITLDRERESGTEFTLYFRHATGDLTV